MTVYVVQTGAAEESFIHSIFARLDDAIALCRKLAQEKSEHLKEIYEKRKFKVPWEVVESPSATGLSIKVAHHCFWVTAWIVKP